MNGTRVSGAPIDQHLHWHDINWAKCTCAVRRHQARIVKATQDSYLRVYKGLSRMKGNFHVRFLGERIVATQPFYPLMDLSAVRYTA